MIFRKSIFISVIVNLQVYQDQPFSYWNDQEILHNQSLLLNDEILKKIELEILSFKVILQIEFLFFYFRIKGKNKMLVYPKDQL